MAKKVAYKQTIEHVNEKSPSPLMRFESITNLSKTYYNPNLPKTTDINEFLKRAVRYQFTVFLKSNGVVALPLHTFIYDDLKQAKKMHSHYMKAWIDEQIEPYRKLVQKGKTLTEEQLRKCEEIQNLYKDD